MQVPRENGEGVLKTGGYAFTFFAARVAEAFLGASALRGGLGSARQHAKLFEQLFLAAQGHLGDLEILRSPSVEGSQSGILFTRGLAAPRLWRLPALGWRNRKPRS